MKDGVNIVTHNYLLSVSDTGKLFVIESGDFMELRQTKQLKIPDHARIYSIAGIGKGFMICGSIGLLSIYEIGKHQNDDPFRHIKTFSTGDDEVTMGMAVSTEGTHACLYNKINQVK